MTLPQMAGETTTSSSGQPAAASSSQTMDSSHDAAAAAAVLLRHVHAEVAEPAGLGPQLVGLLAGPGLLQPVRVAVAGGQLRHRLAQQLLLGALGEVHQPSWGLGVDHGQHVAGVHLRPGRHPQLGHRARGGRQHRVLHLHRLQREQRLAGGDPVALGHQDREHQAGHRRGERAGRQRVSRLRQRVHFGQRHRPARTVHVGHGADGMDVVRAAHAVPLQHDPVRGRRQHRVRRRPVGHLDRPVGTLVRGRGRLGRVVAPAGRQGAAAPARSARRRADAASAAASAASPHLVRRRRAARAPPGAGRGSRCRSRPARKPGDRSTRTSRSRLVSDAVDPGAGQRVGEPARGRRPGRRPGDQLGQHRVVVRRRPRRPATTPESSRRPRPPSRVHPGHGQAVQRAGRRPPARRRVLGVEPHLDGVPAHRWRLGERQRLALGDRDLQRDQVQPQHRLGDRVLDLQPGVHLQEGRLAVGVERGTRPCRPRRSRPTGPPPPPPRAAARAARPARAGDGASSMIFWWRRWIEHSRSPSASTVPCAVREDLHLDVPRRAPAYGSTKTVPSPNADSASRRAAATALVQRGPVRHDPHPAPAAAVRRLDQQRDTARRPAPRPAPRSAAPARRPPRPAPWRPPWTPSRRSRPAAGPTQPARRRARRGRSRRPRRGSRSRGGRRRRRPAARPRRAGRRAGRSRPARCPAARPRRPPRARAAPAASTSE